MAVAGGCGTGSPTARSIPILEDGPPPPPVLPRSPDHPAVSLLPLPDGGAVDVTFVQDGLSDYYAYFFRYSETVEGLEASLAPLVAAPEVRIRGRYDPVDRAGFVDLLLPPSEPAALAVAAAWERTEVLDLGPLRPLLAALDGYRDAVGARFDMRIYAFRVGIEVALPGGGSCVLAEEPGGPPVLAFAPVFDCVRDAGAFQVRAPEGRTWPTRPETDGAAGVAALISGLAAVSTPPPGAAPPSTRMTDPPPPGR